MRSIVVRAVPNLRAQLGFIADRFFDAPSASLTVAGITGTNGKTTCAWLLAQALSAAAAAPPTSARSAAARSDALSDAGHHDAGCGDACTGCWRGCARRR